MRRITAAAEQLILEKGLGKPIIGVLTVVGALIGIGVTAPLVLPAVACAIVVLLFLVIVAQALERRRLTREVNKAAKVLNRYAGELTHRQVRDSFHIIEWCELQEVAQYGDTMIEQTLTLQVGDQPLPTCWIKLDKMHERDGNPIDTNKVRFDVAAIEEDGSLGVSIPVTPEWNGNSVRLFAHFENAFPPRSIVRVRFKTKWPRYAESIVLNRDVFRAQWTFRRKCEKLSCTLKFDEKLGLSGPLRITPKNGSPRPSHDFHRKPIEVTFAMENISPSQPGAGASTTVGFMLQQA